MSVKAVEGNVQPVKGKCSVPFPLEGRKGTSSDNGSSPPPGGLPAKPLGVKSDWRHAGEASRIDGFCERPQLMINIWTGEYYHARCGSARPSRCEPCALVKKRDVASVARSGWTDRVADRGYWTSLTAPGEDRLPWDTSLCTHSPTLQCSGKLFGCVVEEMALAAWHDKLALAWTHFMTDLRRLLNPGLDGAPSSWPVQVEFFKTYEPQARQALHIHSMMRVTGPCTDRRFRAMYKLALKRNGFGKQHVCEQVDISDPLNAARKAGYCSKYSTKCADLLPDVKRLDVCTGELRVGGFRSWSSSRTWGETMKQVRERRRLWASGGRSAPADAAGASAEGALDSYQEIYAGQAEDLIVAPVSERAATV